MRNYPALSSFFHKNLLSSESQFCERFFFKFYEFYQKIPAHIWDVGFNLNNGLWETLLHTRLRPNIFHTKSYGPGKSQNCVFLGFNLNNKLILSLLHKW